MGRLCPGQTAIVVYAWSSAAPERAVHYVVEAARRELIEEVRGAARRDATAIAAEGTRLALDAGLDATPLIFEDADGTADAVVHWRRRSLPSQSSSDGASEHCSDVAASERDTRP